jgi:hypothetical protein
MMAADLSHYMERVARVLLGEPNRRLSFACELDAFAPDEQHRH